MSSTIGISADLLASYYAARAGVSTTASSTTGTSASTTATTPWASGTTAAPVSTLVKSVLANGKYFSGSTATLGPTTGDSSDAKTLFTLYQGLNALQGVAQQAQQTSNSSYQMAQQQASFAAGLTQLSTFLAANPLKSATIVQSSVAANATTKVGVKTESDSYVGQSIYTGPQDGEVPAFQGDVSFGLSLTKASGAAATVNFDLSEMGSTPRTMGNVVSYLNGKLADAGVLTRFSSLRTPATPDTTTVGGQKVTLAPAGADSYALQLNGFSTEDPQFTAPDAHAAVYVAQAADTTSGTAQQLLKVDGDPASSSSGARLFSDNLPANVSAVRSTVTGADGSVYVLADVNAAGADGQTLKGTSDVALLKYDSTGALQFTRTLGAESSASGVALAVSADGSQVAVTGTTTGALDKDHPSADPTQPDTFVSLFDSQGVEQWTQTAGGAGDTPAAVTFGPDNAVYVTGKTNSNLPGTSSHGGQDAFLIGYDAGGGQMFADQFGTGGSDAGVGVVATADGVTVASTENGHAVLRQFDPSSGAAGATRDLGDLQGGSLAGLSTAADGSLVVAGSTSNGALSAGTVTNAYAGGSEVFAATLSPDLSASSSDRLTYWDAGANASAAALTVSGGEVYVTGQLTGSTPAGSTRPNTAGYAVALDVAAGQATWSQTFGGSSGQTAPTSIAVDAQGASTLDRLGLPSSAITYAQTDDLIANTSLRPGDQFEVQVGKGAPTTVTIAQGETMDSLALKIQRASNFYATATTKTVGGYSQLTITPANSRTTVQILPGPKGQDALSALGLYEGALTAQATGASTPKATGQGTAKTYSVAKPYALNVLSTLNVGDATAAKRAQTLITQAMSTVKTAYADITGATTAAAAAAKASTVPAYLTAQIANYQLALSRLTGASS